jgi:uncharacterized membrane protein
LTLGHQPLWLEELLAAIFSAGKGLGGLPRGTWLRVDDLERFLQLNPAATLSSVVRTVTTDDVHPPLFFYLSHLWFRAASTGHLQDLALRLRLFSAGASSIAELERSRL